MQRERVAERFGVISEEVQEAPGLQLCMCRAYPSCSRLADKDERPVKGFHRK